jgi:hypothetical protein
VHKPKEFLCTGTLHTHHKTLKFTETLQLSAVVKKVHECFDDVLRKYEGVSKSFRTGRLARELQMVQLSATRCSCFVIFWVRLMSFAAITLYVASQRVIPKVNIYFVIDSVRKLLDTHSYMRRILFLRWFPQLPVIMPSEIETFRESGSWELPCLAANKRSVLLVLCRCMFTFTPTRHGQRMLSYYFYGDSWVWLHRDLVRVCSNKVASRSVWVSLLTAQEDQVKRVLIGDTIEDKNIDCHTMPSMVSKLQRRIVHSWSTQETN